LSETKVVRGTTTILRPVILMLFYNRKINLSNLNFKKLKKPHQVS
jgi:hypothetical protein